MLYAVSEGIVYISISDSQSKVQRLSECWGVCMLSVFLFSGAFIGAWEGNLRLKGYISISENWERLEFIYTLICALCVFPWHKCILHYNFMLRSLCWRIMISYLNYLKHISLFLLWNIYWIIYFYLCGYLSDIHRDQKRALDPLEVELQIVVSNGMGAWSWTQVLCRFS